MHPGTKLLATCTHPIHEGRHDCIAEGARCQVEFPSSWQLVTWTPTQPCFLGGRHSKAGGRGWNRVG